jgi:XXXCH domain-containing protein
MSDGRNQKSERLLSPAEAADFLRRLADQFAAGSLEIGAVVVALDQDLKLKQSVKTKPDKIAFKLKLKYEKSLLPAGLAAAGHPALAGDDDEDDEEQEAQGRPAYKSLKKHMASSFKALKASLGQGRPVEVEVVHSFVHDCHLMCTFPGKGDPMYPPFIALADRLLTTVEAGDLEGARAVLAELDAQKTACHDEYK